MSLLGFHARNHPQQVARDDVDDRATDRAFFAQLHERFCFTLDVAASHVNYCLPRYYTRADDGLAQPWRGERVWCNPPFSDVRPWLEKAWADPADLVVMLLPANRTEQSWWQDLVEPHRDRGGSLTVEFLRGRLRFAEPHLLTVPSLFNADGAPYVAPNSRPPFGCCLLIWENHS